MFQLCCSLSYLHFLTYASSISTLMAAYRAGYVISGAQLKYENAEILVQKARKSAVIVLKYKAFFFLPWSLSRVVRLLLFPFDVILTKEKLKCEAIPRILPFIFIVCDDSFKSKYKSSIWNHQNYMICIW